MIIKVMLKWRDYEDTDKEVLSLNKSQKRLLDWLKHNCFLAEELEITELEDVNVTDLTTEMEDL